MPIVSNKEIVGGQPRIDGTRIWVSHIVEYIEEFGSVEEYLNQFPTLCCDIVKMALDYCRNEKCVDNVIRYCQGCNKDTSPPLRADPERKVYIVDAPLDDIFTKWNLQGKVVIQGTREDINRKRDLWKLARELYEKHFDKK